MTDKETVGEEVAAEAEPGNDEESQTLVMVDEMDYGCPGTPVQDEPTYDEALLDDTADIAAPVTGTDKSSSFHVAPAFTIPALCPGVRPGAEEAPDEALDYEDDLEEQTAVSKAVNVFFSFFLL